MTTSVMGPKMKKMKSGTRKAIAVPEMGLPSLNGAARAWRACSRWVRRLRGGGIVDAELAWWRSVDAGVRCAVGSVR